MAEGGDENSRKVDVWMQRQNETAAEGEDLEEQENELFALEAIFENEDLEICKHDNPHGHLPGGIFNIPVNPGENFQVKITKDLRSIRRMAYSAVQGRGRGKKVLERKAAKLSEQEASDNADAANVASKPGLKSSEKLYPVKRLPPITLTFAYPHDYPSVSPPIFTLSCCWLERKNLTRLCEKLDNIWTKHQGSPVIAEWHDFLSNDVLDFLDIKSPYDLGRVLVHIFTHPRGYAKQKNTYFKPRPLDIRGIQTFNNIDDVLPTVLDFNLVTCDVCFEEKPGHQFLRLVNCDEHVQCKSCMGGWIEANIKEGAVRDLKCPGFKCDKNILPTEVASVVSEELYQRYDKLLLKTAFDVMPDVLNCPRSFCQFPVLLEDNLGLCPQCNHAFCGRCQNTYHGHSPCKLKAEMCSILCEEYESATPARKQELEMRYGKQVIQRALEETKSNRWLESNSKQCPCCSTFIQKVEGCNSMHCRKCGQSFCYLCGASVSRRDPYAHFSNEGQLCFGRLFEGEDLNNLFPENELFEDEFFEEDGMFDDA